MAKLINRSAIDDYGRNFHWESPYRNRYPFRKVQKEFKLETHVVSNEKGFTSLKLDWEKLVKISSVHVFQTFEWNHIWWKYFGEKNKLHILVFKYQHTVVGIAPFFVDEFRLFGHIIYSCLRFIGSTISQSNRQELKGLMPYTDYLDVIIHPGFELSVLKALKAYLKNLGPKYNELVLDEVSENSLLNTFFLDLIAEVSKITVTPGSVCPVVEIKRTWDDYLSDMSRHARSQIRRYIRKTNDKEQRIFKIIQLTTGDDITRAFDRLVWLHQKRWNQLGFPGVFAESRMVNFLKEVVLEFSKKGWLKINVLEPLNEPGNWVAVDLMFYYNKILYLAQRSFDTDTELDCNAPGNVMLYSTLYKLFRQKKITVYDFLRGDENYKFRAANKVIRNATIVITNPAKFDFIHNQLNIGIRYYVQFRRRFLLEIEKLALTCGQDLSKGAAHYLNRISRHRSSVDP